MEKTNVSLFMTEKPWTLNYLLSRLIFSLSSSLNFNGLVVSLHDAFLITSLESYIQVFIAIAIT